MSALWQKFKVQIPEGYTPLERESIARDVIDFVVERTQKGKDKDNSNFRPGYSKGYAESRIGQLAGKSKGATPDLTLTHNMLESLGEYLKHVPGEITIGYNKGTEENAKADGNVRGTYGKKSPQVRGRNFMGITDKDLAEILSNYPLKGKNAAEDRFTATVENAKSKAAAIKLARSFSSAHDLSFEDLMQVVNDKYGK